MQKVEYLHSLERKRYRLRVGAGVCMLTGFGLYTLVRQRGRGYSDFKFLGTFGLGTGLLLASSRMWWKAADYTDRIKDLVR
jgi:hypothetical protein